MALVNLSTQNSTLCQLVCRMSAGHHQDAPQDGEHHQEGNAEEDTCPEEEAVVEEYQITSAQFSKEKVKDGKSQHEGYHQQVEVPAPKEPQNVIETGTVHLSKGHFATAAFGVEGDGGIDSQPGNGGEAGNP